MYVFYYIRAQVVVTEDGIQPIIGRDIIVFYLKQL